MVKEFEEMAFSLDPGQVSEPFKTQYGWHILKVEERKGEGDSLEVRARHILLQVQAGRNTLDSLRLSAEEFVDRVQETGFDPAAADMGLTPQETGFLTTSSFFPVLRNRSAALVRSLLEASPGESSPLYSTEQGLYVFVLREKRPAGRRPLEEVRNRITTQLKTRKKVDIASQRVSALLDKVRGGVSLEAAAKVSGLRFSTPPAFARKDVVPGIGARTAFTGEAFRLEQGAVSGVISAERGAYVMEVLEKRPIDEADFEEAMQALSERLLSQKRNETASAWYEAIRDESEIVDNRHRFGYDY
jgi:peptidyl-prolyl cis-trans isomerase D